MTTLAAFPGITGQPLEDSLCEVLGSSAGVVGVHCVILTWDDPVQPRLHWAEWRNGTFHRGDVSPETFAPIVAPELADLNFMCRHTSDPNGAVFYASTARLVRWRGAAVSASLRARFSMDAVLTVAFKRDLVHG